ncbi:MAG: hypothetical protein Q4C95_11565 [Planctomycetia bacterium]|nr:hypothetical protein [Planctomycetia bacterium]
MNKNPKNKSNNSNDIELKQTVSRKSKTSPKKSHSHCNCHRTPLSKDENDFLDDQEFGSDDILEPDFQLSIQELLKRFEDEKLFNKSIKELKNRIKNDKNDTEIKLLLATLYFQRATFYQEEENNKKATADYKSSIKLIKAVLSQNPDDFQAHRQLGINHLSYGIFLNEFEDWENALNQYKLAQNEFNICREQGDIESGLDFIGIILNQANCYYALEQYQDALAKCIEGVDQFRAFSKQHHEYRDDSLLSLAKGLQLQAFIIEEIDKLTHFDDEPKDKKSLKNQKKCRTLCQEATDILRKLNAGNQKKYQLDLAESLYGLTLYIDEKDEKISLIDEALELFQSLLNSSDLSDREKNENSFLLELKIAKAVLLELENRKDEALYIYDNIINTGKPFPLVYEKRSNVQTSVKEKINDLTSAIKLRLEINDDNANHWQRVNSENFDQMNLENVKIKNHEHNCESDTFFILENLNPLLTDFYLRALLFLDTKEPRKALKDCNAALKLIKNVQSVDKTIFDTFLELFNNLKASLK